MTTNLSILINHISVIGVKVGTNKNTNKIKRTLLQISFKLDKSGVGKIINKENKNKPFSKLKL